MLVKWSEAKNTKHNGRASELDESEAKDWYVLLKHQTMTAFEAPNLTTI